MTEILLTPTGNQESETVEFKRVASVQALAPSVVALLNSRGGQIFVGYSDTGERVGLTSDAVSLARRLTEQLAKAITPKEFSKLLLKRQRGNPGS